MANEPQNDRSGLVTSRPVGLVDVLDRILDKGLVIVGDIKISLTNIELLTLQIRLIICSIDKAEQIGINWWRFDPNLTVPQRTEEAARPEALAEPEHEVKQENAPADTVAPTAPRKTKGATARGKG